MDPAVVDVAFEERYWYPHDGGVVWVSGYQLVDRESGRYLARDAPEVVAAGLIVASVAGAARHHAQALADEARRRPRPAAGAAPRPRQRARPQCDRRAPRGRRRAAGLGAARGRDRRGRGLDAGRPWAAVALRERRPSPRDPRTGLTMLLAPAPAIELRVR